VTGQQYDFIFSNELVPDSVGSFYANSKLQKAFYNDYMKNR